MDCTSNIAEALAHIKANGVNIAVGCAAAIFDVSLCSVEAILQAVVDSVEAIAKPVGNSAKLAIYILIVKTFEKVGASDRALYSRVAATAEEAVASTEYSKPYKVDKPFVTGWSFPPSLFMSP